MAPRRAVIICSSPRTGSGVLCSALWSTELCGRPDEYLGPQTRADYEQLWGSHGDRAYAEQVLDYATTPNGVFSMKVHWEQMEWVPWLSAALPPPRTGASPLLALAPEVDFYWVRRREKLRQAISMYTRRVTGRFRQLDGEPLPTPMAVPFDYWAIRHLCEEAEARDRNWAQYFEAAAVAPTPIWYEDDIEHGYVDTARAILTATGIERASDVEVTSEYRKQADETSKSLERLFREVERRDSRG
jgi:trehalose 2-sulfotransferase